MRGLLMIEPLYHQTIGGKKVQTRRSGGLEKVNENPDDWYISGEIRPSRVPESVPFTIDSMFSPAIFSYLIFNKIGVGLISHATGGIICKPRYKVGEVLYLKEPWVFLKSDTTCFWNGYAYKFGATPYCAISHTGAELGGTEIKFKNKLFMPAAAARAFIRITGVKCERLLDISDEDCIAEGIDIVTHYTNSDIKGYRAYMGKGCDYYNNPKDSFLSLYKFANKVKEVPNLWVWCYEYEYLKDYKPNTAV